MTPSFLHNMLWRLAGAAIVIGVTAMAHAEELNVYSARHYQTDEALYSRFTKLTGITINRIEDKEDSLLERIVNEGENSPADVFVTVDVGRLWRANQAGIFASVDSPILRERIPEHLRHPEDRWFGFSTRARVIVYAKDRVDPSTLTTYADLADPTWKGKVCIRSSSNVYNLSLLGSFIAHDGEAAAEAWAKGVVDNFARPPEGGDTDQIKAVAAGECDVAVVNTYYLVRLIRSDKPEETDVAAKVGVIFANQGSTGTHVNISGAGVLAHAPHPEAAIKFLEYLVSEEAQRYFADGNNEYPVAPDVEPNEALLALGSFEQDTLPIAEIGAHQPLAQQIFDRVGWK